MNYQQLNKKDRELIEAAKEVLIKNYDPIRHTVVQQSCALLEIFTPGSISKHANEL